MGAELKSKTQLPNMFFDFLSHFLCLCLQSFPQVYVELIELLNSPILFFNPIHSLIENLGLKIIDYGSPKLLLEVTSSEQNTHTMLVNELKYANVSPLLLGSPEDQFV
jgi:hypothetical protein